MIARISSTEIVIIPPSYNVAHCWIALLKGATKAAHRISHEFLYLRPVMPETINAFFRIVYAETPRRRVARGSPREIYSVAIAF